MHQQVLVLSLTSFDPWTGMYQCITAGMKPNSRWARTENPESSNCQSHTAPKTIEKHGEANDKDACGLPAYEFLITVLDAT